MRIREPQRSCFPPPDAIVTQESDEACLARAREEIRAAAAGIGERPLLPRSVPAPDGDGLDLSRSRYGIAELTGPHHIEFVEQAFRAVLKRRPEAAEVRNQLALLASGASKAEVIGNLRYSAEGRRRGVRIAGLGLRYALAKSCRIPILGAAVEWLATLAALPAFARHQRAGDAMFSAAIHDLRGHDRVLETRLDAATTEIGALQDRVAEAERQLQVLGEGQRGQAEAFNRGFHVLNGRYDEMAMLRSRLYSLNHWSHSLGEAIGRIEQAADERSTRLENFAAATARAALASAGVASATWIDALADRIALRARVLAMGCGPATAAALVHRGFDVRCIEPVAALANLFPEDGETVRVERTTYANALARLEGGSIDAVVVAALGPVLRRMPLMDLLDGSLRALRPGGALLMGFSREPIVIVDEMLDHAHATPDAALLRQAVADSGFEKTAEAGPEGTFIALKPAQP